METPDIDKNCSEHFTYRNFIECSDSWRRTRVDNIPREIATYHAIEKMSQEILEPVYAKFGEIYLTYGFSSAICPFHVSVGSESNASIVYMKGFLGGRHQPHVMSKEKIFGLNTG